VYITGNKAIHPSLAALSHPLLGETAYYENVYWILEPDLWIIFLTME